jgi:uncharacterized protein (TIGR00251 family)
MIMINVKVVPGSSRDAVVGLLDDSLKVKVVTPLEGGKANKSLAKILAKCLEIKPDQVIIKSGHQSKKKVVEIHSFSFEQYETRLSQL